MWMFPEGRRRGGETEKGCLRREIREELPKLWKEVKAKNPRSGRRMSDAYSSLIKSRVVSLSVTRGK